MKTREIKFRMFDLTSNKMIKYPIDGITQNPLGKSISDNLRPIISISGNICFPHWGKKCITMQFIGLLDSKGKKIYEGDIVNGLSFNGSYCYGKVVYIKNSFIVIPVKKFIDGTSEDFQSSEVIGNIYENPELVEN